MEIDVTDIVQDMPPPRPLTLTGAPGAPVAGPQESRGPGNAWKEACGMAAGRGVMEHPEVRRAMRDYLVSTGAWEQAEAAALPLEELCALLIQLVAGDMHEAGLRPDSTPDEWEQYAQDGQEGRVPSNLFRGGEDGRFYYTLEG